MPVRQPARHRPPRRGPDQECVRSLPPQRDPAPRSTVTSPSSCEGITKRFPGVVANKDINFTGAARHGPRHRGRERRGQVHPDEDPLRRAAPDEGTIKVNGQVVTLHSPTDAIGAGIGMVFQHFMLADNFTVLENVVLGAEKMHGIGPTRPASADPAASPTPTASTSHPDALVEDLGVGDRQRVEILKVLYRGAKILILDEPTAVLVPQEVDELFDNLRELKTEGLTVMFISHKLDEVLAVADSITVIRRGTTVDTVDPKSVNARQLAELMVGSRAALAEHRGVDRHRPGPAPRRGPLLQSAPEGTPAARRHPLHHPRAARCSASPASRATARAELVEVIMGDARAHVGLGVPRRHRHLRLATRARSARRGVAYIPEDRHRHGTAARGPPLGEPHARPPDRGAQRPRLPGQRRPAPRPTPSASCGSTTSAPRRSSSPAGVAVRRQPAEAHRRPRDEPRPQGARGRPPHARRGRRGPGQHLGPDARGPVARAWPSC